MAPGQNMSARGKNKLPTAYDLVVKFLNGSKTFLGKTTRLYGLRRLVFLLKLCGGRLAASRMAMEEWPLEALG